MSKQYLTGYKFETAPHVGYDRGVFHVRPDAAIPERDRKLQIDSVYVRTPSEIASNLTPYRPQIPKKSRQQSVYAFVNQPSYIGAADRSLIGDQSVIGHAIGTHEKVGRGFKKQSVANIDSFFTRRYVASSEHELDIRGSGIGHALGYALLGEFDEDDPVTVMELPALDKEGDFKVYDTLKSLGFVVMNGGHTSRHNSASNSPWYLGPPVKEVREAMASGSHLLSWSVSYPFEAPEPAVDPIAVGLGTRPGMGSFR
jgi:hypothetical protein